VLVSEGDAQLEQAVGMLRQERREVERVRDPLVLLVVGPAKVKLLAPDNVAYPLELVRAVEVVDLHELQQVVAVDEQRLDDDLREVPRLEHHARSLARRDDGSRRLETYLWLFPIEADCRGDRYGQRSEGPAPESLLHRDVDAFGPAQRRIDAHDSALGFVAEVSGTFRAYEAAEILALVDGLAERDGQAGGFARPGC
jgi:hypothetical protein